MNANQIINMVVRMVMRKLLRTGVNAGMNAVGSRMNRGKSDPQSVQNPSDGANQPK